jgi:Domain of unknwon function (DUF3824)
MQAYGAPPGYPPQYVEPKKHGGIMSELGAGVVGAAAGAFAEHEWEKHREKKRREQEWDIMEEEERVRREYEARCTFLSSRAFPCLPMILLSFYLASTSITMHAHVHIIHISIEHIDIIVLHVHITHIHIIHIQVMHIHICTSRGWLNLK